MIIAHVQMPPHRRPAAVRCDGRQRAGPRRAADGAAPLSAGTRASRVDVPAHVVKFRGKKKDTVDLVVARIHPQRLVGVVHGRHASSRLLHCPLQLREAAPCRMRLSLQWSNRLLRDRVNRCQQVARTCSDLRAPCLYVVQRPLLLAKPLRDSIALPAHAPKRVSCGVQLLVDCPLLQSVAESLRCDGTFLEPGLAEGAGEVVCSGGLGLQGVVQGGCSGVQ